MTSIIIEQRATLERRFVLSIFKNKTILITGGTGSFGRAFVKRLVEQHNPTKVIIFSRDELKQLEMKNSYQDASKLRFFIGDIREKERLIRAFEGVDIVVHAAALKQVDTGEYNPREFVLTNVLGTQNVIDASLDTSVQKVLALSTDKASSPINLYGATKLTADKLVTAANVYASASETKFSVVRYGNVLGSRGSVVPLFKNLILQNKRIPITDARMTRFWITLDQALDFVTNSLESMNGGEIFIPKIPSMKIMDLVIAIKSDAKIQEVGIRPGEKLHEEMISVDDARRTIELDDKYILYPASSSYDYLILKGTNVPEGFSYRSNTNTKWLGIDEISKLIANIT